MGVLSTSMGVWALGWSFVVLEFNGGLNFDHDQTILECTSNSQLSTHDLLSFNL